MEIKRRLILIIVAVLCVIMAGSLGYYIIYQGESSFMDCLFMTVISLTTVGYGEVTAVTGNIAAEIFTMVLITFGMGIILYGISTLTAIIIEGELSGMLRKKKMEKEISKLSNHYIVCGGGETGRPVIAELINNGETVVLIEKDEESIERCKEIDDLLYIKGDAADDASLTKAGIDKAAGIIVTLSSDKDNLFTTMSARMLNSRVRIISRVISKSLEPKMRRAGANSVVSPNYIGALRLASEMIRPAAVDFLDSMLRSSRGDQRIHQINVSDQSPLVGKSLMECDLKQDHGLLVLGVRHRNREMEFNPPPDLVLEKGMTLIVMGEIANITKVRQKY